MSARKQKRLAAGMNQHPDPEGYDLTDHRARLPDADKHIPEKMRTNC